ncbi:MAG: hypothetical protein U1E76_18425 [Planctomycetota bacterium]
MKPALYKSIIQVTPERKSGQQVIRCPDEQVYPDGILVGTHAHFYMFLERTTRQGVMADNSGFQVFARYKSGQKMGNFVGTFPAWVRDGGDRNVRYRRIFEELVDGSGNALPNFGSPPWGYDTRAEDPGVQGALGYDVRTRIFPMPCFGWYSIAFNYTTIVTDTSPGADLGIVVATVMMV